MLAAIDVGSNSLRMLLGRCSPTGILPERYQQHITRLAGGYTHGKGLASESMERTLSVFATYAEDLQRQDVKKLRVVGTAALRRAENAQIFVNLVKLKTRLQVEIITGKEEARLCARGVLSALDSSPKTVLIVDIGGGSTEIIWCQDQQILSSSSYPLGVVQLAEELYAVDQRQSFLKDMVVKIATDLLRAGISQDQLGNCQLVGTAGTMTTLAAMNLQMSVYDPVRINNHQLSFAWLEEILKNIRHLSLSERRNLPGLEPGREDLIVPGLELVIALCRYFKQPSIRVSDAGLLEGILLELGQH